MSRRVTRTRLLLLLLLVLNAAWMYAAGSQLAYLVRFRARNPDGYICWCGLILTLLLLAIVRAFQYSKIPSLAANARLGLARSAAVLELGGVAGGLAGAQWGFGTGYAYHYVNAANALGVSWLTWEGILFFLVASMSIPILTAFAARRGTPTPPEPKSHWFLLDLGHVSNLDVVKCLLAGACLLGLILAAAWHAMPGVGTWRVFDEGPQLPRPFLLFGCSFLIGIGFSVIQGHWHRAIGFVPIALAFAFIGISGMLIDPSAEWALIVVGLAGVAHAPVIAGLLAALPANQRFVTLLAYHLLAVLAAILLGAVSAARHYVLLAIALISLFAFTYILFRPFVELVNEVIFRVFWYPVAYGPGKYGLPTRGPALIVGNHAAMFDPVWLSAVIPLRNRAMMISTVLDKPFLKWLCGRIYRAIRVPAEGFRRVAPEIDEAVAALKRGEAVMIFPESFLRRKEEQPLRRFANGVHRILSQCPDTPVITCWIEDGWGSLTSWKNGPPFTNKPKDIVKKIRIGINDLEVLPPDLLKDGIATRRHLMERVLHARTYIGLPAHKMPGFGGKEEKDGKGDE
jgi:1-acyl-sn-glycerol-3-phosphate acyltransferase